MPFEIGNQEAKKRGKDKRFKAALVRMYDADPRKLDRLAQAVHDEAVAGDVGAMTVIRDTLDGKPPQAIVGDDEHPPVLGYREWLAWMVSDRMKVVEHKPLGLSVDDTKLSNDINMKRRLGEGEPAKEGGGAIPEKGTLD